MRAPCAPSAVLRGTVLLGAVGLAACEHEPVLTVVDLRVPVADVALLVSDGTAPVATWITVGIEVVPPSATEDLLGAVQGRLSWDPARLRYVGELAVGRSLLAVNATAADAGALRVAAIDPDGLDSRVAMLAFEVLGPGYAQGLQFETEVLVDLAYARVVARDLRGARTVSDLPSPTLATGPSLAERLTGFTEGELANAGGPSRVPGAADLYGDGNEDGQIDVLDALYAANVAVGNTVLGPCVVGTDSPSRDCLAINVEPANAPGLGESGDTCPPGVENACASPVTRVVDAVDWLAITQEVTGDGHAIVGEPIPNARGGADRTSPPDTVTLSGPVLVTGTRTFSADTLYILQSGELIVGDETGAAGTIVFEPGTVFEGVDSTTGIRVTRNGRIVADGTATAPITFSCLGPAPAPGCWRGLAVLGNAVLNADLVGQPAPAIPGRNTGGGNQIALDADIVFGGSNDADDSGILRYVRVLYAGARYERAPGDVTLHSGLRLGACGSATVIEYVQAHASGQDGIQILGGRCDVDHVISSEAADDLVEISWGYDGSMQYVIGVHGAGADRAFEVANTNDVATWDAVPRTAPSIWNLTVIGGSQASPLASGLDWRQGAQGEVRNALLVQTQLPFEVTDGSCPRLPSQQNLLAFDDIVVLGRGGALSASADCPTELANDLGQAGVDDRAYANELIDPFTGWLPDLRPVGTGVVSGAGTPATPPAGLDNAPYFGALRPESAGGALPWYAGWFEPWEPLPGAATGGQDYRIVASCRDRLGGPTDCTLAIFSDLITDTVAIGPAGDTLVVPKNRDVGLQAWDSTGFWLAPPSSTPRILVNGGPGEIDTVVFDLVGKGGELCGGGAESLDLVTVRPNSGCPAIGVVSTPEEAIFLVRDGGVIEFGRGEHRVIDQDVVRDGLTLRAVSGEEAILVVGTPPDNTYDGPGFKLLGGGDYLIQDLVFRRRAGQNGGLGVVTGPNNIHGMGAYALVTLERTRFEGLRLAVVTMPSTAANPRIDILDSEFTNVTPGDFFGGRSILMIDRDSVEHRSAAITVRGNRFTGTLQEPMSLWALNGAFARPPSAGFALVVEDNDFAACGAGVCIELQASTDATIVRNNTFSAPDPSVISPAALRVFDPIGATRIEGNVIQGVTAANGYSFGAGVLIEGSPASSGTPTLTANTIQSTTVGLSIAASFLGSVTGTDNTIADVTTVVQNLGPSTLLFTQNDFGGYVTAWSGALGAGSLVCNWWGSVNGPGPSVTDAATVAFPWADGPIANNGAGTCN